MKLEEFFQKRKGLIILVMTGLIVISGVFFNSYGFWAKKNNNSQSNLKTNHCLASDQAIVTKVIDGDTVIVEGGYHIRLLGIDSDEKGYPCYEPAKLYLEKLILGKKVRLERDKTDVDKYGRCLRYIFIGQKNINLEMIKKGLAVARFYSQDVKYEKEIDQAEKKAIENRIGCKWSGLSQMKENKKKRDENSEDSNSGNFHWENLTNQKTGLTIIKSCQAGDYLARKVIVQDKVASSYQSPRTKAVFLNLGRPYPKQCLTLVIFKDDLPKFVNNIKSYYLKKEIRAVGEIKEYKGKPEIILTNPSQIEVGK